MATIALLGGIFGALVIGFTMGFVDEGVFIHNYKPNPDGLVLTFAVLFSSVATSSYLFVVCVIAENIIAIRKNIEK